MVVLDLVVVNVALPSIQADLGLSSSDLEWVVIAYGLTFGGLLLLGGRAADLVGRRTMLGAGLSAFTTASLGAGVSHSLVPLLACRAVQGLGAAMTAPAALSILTSTFAEGAPRNRALGVFGGVAGTAASGGLVVGGLLSGGPGWPWIFFINVPIGAALMVLAFAYIPKSEPAHGSADVLGAVTVTAGLLAIVFAVSKSVDYGWTSSTTIGVLLSGAVMLGLFVVAERRAPVPLIALSMFRSPTLTSANVITVLVMGSFFGFAFQTTLFLQQVLGYSPTRTGAALIVGAASSVVVAGVIALSDESASV
jgi:MFS family permease